MEATARDFLSDFDWCDAILELYFGDGIGDVFAVFLARIAPARPSVDEHLWVVVGDLPPAYLVTDVYRNPNEALEGYIREMRKWVALAKQGQMSRNVIPVNAPATPEWAEVLEGRLDALEQKIITAGFTPPGSTSQQMSVLPAIRKLRGTGRNVRIADKPGITFRYPRGNSLG